MLGNFFPVFQILSRDSVTVSVDAVVYFNVIDSEQALCSVDDFSHSTRLLAATTLRNVLGTKVDAKFCIQIGYENIFYILN